MKIIVLFGIIQCIYVIFYLNQKNRNGYFIYIIGIYYVLLILQIESFLLRSGFIEFVIHALNISTPTIFLIGPFLLFSVNREFKNKINFIKIAWHFIPFILFFFYSFNFYLQSSNFKYNLVANSFHPEWPLRKIKDNIIVDPWDINGIIVVELLTLHVLLYSIITFYKLLKNKKKIKREKMNWLLFLCLIVTLGAITLLFSQGVVIANKIYFDSPFPELSADLFSTIAIYATMAYLLIHPKLLDTKNKKYINSELPQYYKREKLKMIKLLVENDPIYLDSEFSLKMLSEKTELSVHHISQILNDELKSTFFEFTNHYRIKAAKEKLIKEDYIKIEQLAFSLGYKSKSTFFKAFKKETQLTPLQFRKKFT